MNWTEIAGSLITAGTGQGVTQTAPDSIATQTAATKQDNTIFYIAIFAGILMFAGVFYLIIKK